MADRELARQTWEDAQRRIRAIIPVASPTGLVAAPLFREFSLGTIEHLLDVTMSTPEEIAKSMATPTGWRCESFKASTAQQAIDLANNARISARRINAVAAKQAQAGALPMLSGSEKQRAWANKIRADHAAKSPESTHLQEQRVAAWWIDNRRTL